MIGNWKPPSMEEIVRRIKARYRFVWMNKITAKLALSTQPYWTNKCRKRINLIDVCYGGPHVAKNYAKFKQDWEYLGEAWTEEE